MGIYDAEAAAIVERAGLTLDPEGDGAAEAAKAHGWRVLRGTTGDPATPCLVRLLGGGGTTFGMGLGETYLDARWAALADALEPGGEP